MLLHIRRTHKVRRMESYLRQLTYMPIQELSGNATLLYYLSEEGDEGRAAWNEKRPPNFRKFPWLP